MTVRTASIVLLFATLVAAAAQAQQQPLVEHVLAHPDGRAPWSLDRAALAGERAALPVGVFDSGIGGLTVLEAILALDRFHNDTLAPGGDGRPDFAGERFLYLGDQANMPYGNYPAAGREMYLRELALKDAVFLLGTRWRESAAAPPRHDKPPVKAIVIACNTATAYGLEDVRAALSAWRLDVPVIGVVEAGARTLAGELPSDGAPATIAVMATAGTCASGAYPRAIASAAGKLGKPAPPVVQQGSAALAGAIEGNRAYVTSATGAREAAYAGPAPDPALAAVYGFDPAGMRGGELNSVANHVRYEAATLLEAQRRAGGPPISSVVLGCTHYPLVKDDLAAALAAVRAYRAPDGTQPYAATVAADVQFVDPAEATARELFVALATGRLRAPGARKSAAAPTAAFSISVPNPAAPGVRLAADGALDAAYRIGRATGRLDLEDTVVVPLTAATLPPSSAQLVRSLPHVWQALAGAAEEPARRSPREKDERGMRIYYMGFLTRGPAWTPEVTEATKKLQAEHLANISRLAEDGRLLIAGPFAYDATDADQSLRGIFIFDTETRAEAEELAATDPAVKAGRLAIRVVPWYGPYGLTYEDQAKYVKKP